ncbi:MAG: hypothetical protein KA052_01440 [Candidatus Pacebacteria bacterium]|nr:hypothetical protein [Candidatus Paceibacterota bacterium]
MKKMIMALPLMLALHSLAQTSFQQTNEKFKNGEYVWELQNDGERVGEFWPVHGLNLVTKDLNPSAFNGTDIQTIQQSLKGVATAPDGMTTGSYGSYQLQGRCLSRGKTCGDGSVYEYGIIAVSPNGFAIEFTHKNEIKNFDSFYAERKRAGGTIFFLPSVYRNGTYLSSQRTIDKVFIRRTTPTGIQIGVVIFDELVTYDRAREIITGLDRNGKSSTTHIYVLDGGPRWGQSCKEVNGEAKLVGTRNPNVVTNYLVFY